MQQLGWGSATSLSYSGNHNKYLTRRKGGGILSSLSADGSVNRNAPGKGSVATDGA
jgi:hypothetical protein